MQRLKTVRSTAALLLALGIMGCSGGGGAGNVYRSDMGRLLAGPLIAAREKVWTRHQVPLYREEREFQRILFESQWMPRQPTPAEQANGVEQAQNRIVIEGRRLEEGLDEFGTVYRVTFTLHNQVTTSLNPGWHPTPAPDAVIDRYREVLREMEIELRTGVRR